MIWLLDTNVLIHAVRGRPPAVRARLQQQSPDDVAVSSVTVAELWYGAEKSESPERKREAWATVLAPFQVVPSIAAQRNTTHGFAIFSAADRSESAIC